MRFGRRTHDTEPDAGDPKIDDERTRLVGLLRNLADRIEHAPKRRVIEALAELTSAVEPLVRAVERALK